ncbi:MAG: SPL family radical SAM protein [Caldisericia bacterium]
MFKIQEVKVKKTLQKSKISQYCINPYLGCLNGCLYCYASFIMQKWHHKEEAWGSFVDVRVNSVENLKKELRNKNKIEVYISSMTDPYQEIEEKYQLSRGVLKVFLLEENSLFDKKFSITIQTKGDLVLRDLDILKELKDKTIGFTITILDEEKRKIFEKGASPTYNRLKALEVLNKEKIKTYAFFGPILPRISDSYEEIYKIVKLIYDAGTREIFFDKLSYFRFMRRIKEVSFKLGLYNEFLKSESDFYLSELKFKINTIIKEFKGLTPQILF